MNNSENETMLQELRLSGMAKCYAELVSSPIFRDMSSAEVVGRLCIAQRDTNKERRVASLSKRAKFRTLSQPEDISWKRERGLDKQKHSDLLLPNWVRRQENLLLTGCAGTGKTWVACAIGHALVRNGIPVLYVRTKLMLEDLRIARLDGTLSRMRKSLARPELLILDDFGISPIDQSEKEDLFEVIEARSGKGSILVAGQLSPKEWHTYLNSDHLADAIMDRLFQNSHSIQLKGDSWRKTLK